MYTKEPNYFDEEDPSIVEHEIDLMFPDYDPIDWDEWYKNYKKFLYFSNIEDLLRKHNFRFSYHNSARKYRIYFKDQADFNRFNRLRRYSKLLKTLKPERDRYNIDISGCMDYYFK